MTSFLTGKPLASREGRRGSMADRFPAQNNRPGN